MELNKRMLRAAEEVASMRSSEVIPLVESWTLPFHIGVLPEPTNSGFPSVLQFQVGVRPEFGLLSQVFNSDVHHYLELAYRKGSLIGTPMTDAGFGQQYAEDFLAAIVRFVQPSTLRGLRVLEIGCGNGYLLGRLNELGAEVVGIEPGEQGQRGAAKYGIPIIRDMFPSDHDALQPASFDLVIHYGVLEHVPDPWAFLEGQTKLLKETGFLIFAVPDCSEHTASGDVSMFLHEHYSYFTPYSIKKLVESIGYHLLHIEQSSFGGSLYTVSGRQRPSIDVRDNTDDIQQFERNMRRGILNTTRFFCETAAANRTTGVYCPSRIINLLYLSRPEPLPRLFDDDPNIRGKYYPPFPMPIETRSSLLERPVDNLIIMSRSFGRRLRETLSVEHGLAATRVILPDDLLNGAGG